MLKAAFKGPVKLVVDSVGGKGDKGDFVLIDTVKEGDKPARTRKWIMRTTGPGRFTGTLSDATGPVEVAVSGDQATIRYTMKGGLNVQQQNPMKVYDELVVPQNCKDFLFLFDRIDGFLPARGAKLEDS